MGRPPFDPWLAHLRRDRRGLPVPFINMWGEQTIANTRVAHDPLVGMRATFVDDDAEGLEPNFLKQNPQRQQECMILGGCQVCGKPVPWSRRNLVISSLAIDFVREDGVNKALIYEPWLCDRCCDIAVNWCPALIRRRRDEQLIVHRVTSKRECVFRVATGCIDGPLRAETQADPVAMMVKIQLLNLDLVPHDGRYTPMGDRP